MSKLTDVAIRNAKPEAKPKRLSDGGGLYLEISPAGGKLWRLKYRFGGKEKRLALGIYPTITLAEARERREAARKLLAHGTDPGNAKKEAQAKAIEKTITFEAVARDWFVRYRRGVDESTSETVMHRLEMDIFPWIGDRPIKEITTPELLSVLQRVEDRGAVETARRDMQKCSAIFRHAVITGHTENNVAEALRGVIPPLPKRHHASITDPRQLGQLLRDIEGYQGTHVVRCAFKLSPLVFLRPGELRKGEWAEIDFDRAMWRIPAKRMKMKKDHLIPLSHQAIGVLREIWPLTNDGVYIFPGAVSRTRPMSENALRAALRRMGYTNDDMTPHGFRSSASTMLNEHGWDKDSIELQLSHTEQDEIRGAYNFATKLVDRRSMMQTWADYLDALKEGKCTREFEDFLSLSQPKP